METGSAAISTEILNPYNSRIIEAYVKFLTAYYPEVDIYRLLKHSGMTPYEVEDHGHWFSQDQVDKFYYKLVEITGDQDIARKAGQYMGSPEASGEVRYFFIGVIGLLNAYKMVIKASKTLTKSTTFEVNPLSDTSVEIVVRPIDGHQEKEYQCQNRIGMFEAVADLVKAHKPVIEHPQCMFKGDDCCRYLISWEKSSTKTIRLIRNGLIPASLLFNTLFLSIYHPSSTVGSLSVLSSLSAILLMSLCIYQKENREYKEILESSTRSPEKWIEQIDINYNNNLLSYEIGQTISMHTSIDDVLSSVVQISEKRLDYDRGAVFLADKNKELLEYRSGFGYVDNFLAILHNNKFHIDKPGSRGIFVKSFNEQQSFLINDIEEVEADLSPKSLNFSRSIGSKAFICCPIVYERESLGIFVVDNIISKRKLTQRDLRLLMGIASSIGISLKTAELFEIKEAQFKSTFEVLALSIDARDNLTSGHSETVAKYSVEICKAMGLDTEYTEVVRLAALFHDYGKIGIPDSILKKKGPLTDQEYTIIKSHVVKTKELLNKITFEGSYQKVPKIAGAHHERMDGRGYPDGLAGSEIPLGGRIIAVADFFEAITAKRHYRNPMTIYAAITQLMIAAGDHLDEEIVNVFVKYLQKTHSLELGTPPLAV